MCRPFFGSCILFSCTAAEHVDAPKIWMTCWWIAHTDGPIILIFEMVTLIPILAHICYMLPLNTQIEKECFFHDKYDAASTLHSHIRMGTPCGRVMGDRIPKPRGPHFDWHCYCAAQIKFGSICNSNMQAGKWLMLTREFSFWSVFGSLLYACGKCARQKLHYYWYLVRAFALPSRAGDQTSE